MLTIAVTESSENLERSRHCKQKSDTNAIAPQARRRVTVQFELFCKLTHSASQETTVTSHPFHTVPRRIVCLVKIYPDAQFGVVLFCWQLGDFASCRRNKFCLL